MFGFQSLANTKAKEPLSPKFSRLLREAWWIAALLGAAYVALILFTYNKADPGWSHSGTHGLVLNRGGDVGAWLADLLLYLFGLSAWWIVGLGVFGIWRSYHRIETTPLTDKRPLYISLGGFAVLLLASSGMEALRLYSLKAALPMAPGGVFGAVLGKGLGKAFGFTGSTLVLIGIFAIGLSLFSGLSWLKFVEWGGRAWNAPSCSSSGRSRGGATAEEGKWR